MPPAGFGVSNSGCNGCECWVYVAPSLLGVGLPGTYINFRIPGCVDPPPPPPPPPIPPEPLAPGLIIPPDSPNPIPDGQIPGCQYFAFISVQTYAHFDDYPYSHGDSPLKSVWDRIGGFDGMILPVYDPILGLKYFFNSDGHGGGTLHTVLECGGGGNLRHTDTGYESTKVDGIDIIGGAYFTISGWLQWVNDSRPDATGPSSVWRLPPRSVLGTDQDRYYIKTETGTILYPVISQYRAWNHPPFHTFAFHDIRRAADIAPWRGSVPWGSSCTPYPPPPPPPPRRPPEPPDDDMCNCADLSALIDYKLRPIYQFLQLQQYSEPQFNVSPEDLIKTLGRTIYRSDDPGSVPIKTISDLMAAIAAAGFHRGGLHRLPAKVPRSLTGDRSRNDQTKIEDMLSWQEWEIKQLDALTGQFSVKIEVTDDADQTATVEFKNLAEGLAEIAGLLLGTAADADLAANLALRATLEASKAGNAAIIGQDYIKAIAQYLGFKGNEVERKVKSTITPGKTKKDEILKESEQKIPGYQWDGTDTNLI